MEEDASASQPTASAEKLPFSPAQLLASIVECSDIAIVTKSLDGLIATWNSGAERLYGYRAEEVLGKSVDFLIPSGQPDELPSIMGRLQRGELIEHYETVRVRKDGGLIDISLTVSPIKSGDGTVIGASTIACDIAERRRIEAEHERLLQLAREQNQRLQAQNEELQAQAEEIQAQQEELRAQNEQLLAQTAELSHANTALLVSERRAEALAGELERERDILQAIMENTSAHLCYLDRQLNFVRVNSTYAAGSGHSAAELIGRNHFELFPNAENQAIFERVRETGEAIQYLAKPFEFSDQPWRGVTYWDWTLTPIKGVDGQVEGLVLSLVDVTEDVRARMRIEELAEEARRRADELDSVFAAMSDVVVVYDAGGTVVRANPAALAAYGLNSVNISREAIGEKLVIRYPDGQPAPLDDLPVARALRGEMVTNRRFIFRDASGHDVTVDASASPLMADGQIRGAVAVWRDVTEREQLLARVQLERQRMEEMIHLIAHDVRQPLTVARGHAQFMQRSLMRGDLERARVSAETIEVSARRLEVMIRDMVDSARLEVGQLQLERQPLDMEAFVRDSLMRLSVALDVSRVRIEVVSPVSAYADPNRLERVLGNLISNAIKYCEPGGEIVVRIQERGHKAMVSVSDQGPGIGPEDLPHLFERGYRAAGEHKSEGLGLGLYIARLLVEAHGGRIWCESEEGKGSSFCFSLPSQ